MVACANADASAVRHVQETERNLLSAEKDLYAMQAERCTLSAKKSHLIGIGKILVGKGVVLGAELRAAQAEFCGFNVAVRWRPWAREYVNLGARSGCCA